MLVSQKNIINGVSFNIQNLDVRNILLEREREREREREKQNLKLEIDKACESTRNHRVFYPQS
jgi:hypothetical protein